MKVVVGLGNPGSQYAGTRHNIGWLVMDRIAERAGWTGKGRQRDAANVVMGRYRGLDLTLVKPLTYMNDSGLAVRKVMAREHAPLHDILIVADDFALPYGRLRFREGGGHGGHNGLRDLIAQLGAGFWRLRLGVGHPGSKDEVIDYVLERPPAAERELIEAALARGLDVVPGLLGEGAQKAMQALHTRAGERS